MLSSGASDANAHACHDHTTVLQTKVVQNAKNVVALGFGFLSIPLNILTALSCTYTTGFLKPSVKMWRRNRGGWFVSVSPRIAAENCRKVIFWVMSQ